MPQGGIRIRAGAPVKPRLVRIKPPGLAHALGAHPQRLQCALAGTP